MYLADCLLVSLIALSELPSLPFALFLGMSPLHMSGLELLPGRQSLRLIATSPPRNHPPKPARFKREKILQSWLLIRNIEFPSVEYWRRQLSAAVSEYDIARNPRRGDTIEVGKLLLN